MSSLEPDHTYMKIRRDMKKETSQLARAKKLVEERDSGKRDFFAMSASDQQLVEDFDTKRLKQNEVTVKFPRLSVFRSTR